MIAWFLRVFSPFITLMTRCLVRLRLACIRRKMTKQSASANEFAEGPRNLVVIRNDALGDFFIFLPALKALYAECHRADNPSPRRLIVVVTTATESFARRCPYQDDVIAYDAAQFAASASYRLEIFNRVAALHPAEVMNPILRSDSAEYIALLAGSSQTWTLCCRFDMPLLPADFLRKSAPKSLAEERRRFGLLRACLYAWASHISIAAKMQVCGVLWYNTWKPFYAHCVWGTYHDFDMVNEMRCIDAYTGVTHPVALLDDMTWAMDDIARFHLPERYYVVVVGSSQNQKSVPSETLAVVVSRVTTAHPAWTAVFTGVAAERPLAETVITQAGVASHAINLCGECSLTEMVAVVQGATVVMSNDTGTSHIAAALKKPLVVMVAQAVYGQFYPNDIYENCEVVMDSKRDCRGCNWLCPYLNKDGKVPCVAAITPEAILAALERLNVFAER